jgi:hypothetical protein
MDSGHLHRLRWRAKWAVFWLPGQAFRRVTKCWRHGHELFPLGTACDVCAAPWFVMSKWED